VSEILTIQFSGRAVSRRKLDENSINSKESKDDFINRNEIVPWLDSHSDYIAEDIEREIKKALPPGVQVNANIEFNYGSIEWAGVVIILDWMARLGSSAGLIEYIAKGVKIAVDKIVRRNIRNQTKYCENINTQVVVTPGNTQSGQIKNQNQLTVPQPTSINWQLVLLVVNVLVSVGILGVLLWGR
jgi:hypothetical protein